MIFIHTPVGENDNLCPVSMSSVHLNKKPLHCFFQTGAFVKQDGNGLYLKVFPFHLLDFQQVCIGENGVIHFQHNTVFRLFLQEIPVFPDIHRCGCDNLLPYGVQGWIGHLGKLLFKIIEQRLVFL